MICTCRSIKIFIVFIIVLLDYECIHSQKSILKHNTESLIYDSYENLFEVFENSKNDIETAEFYAKAFLLKANKENDVLKKAEGYYLMARMLCRLPDYNRASIYLDSSISVSKITKDVIFPAKAHILKANIYGAQSKYQKAMDELALANTYTNISNNLDQQFEIKYIFSVFHKNLDDYEKSTKLLEDVISFYEKKYATNKDYEDEYILSLYAYTSNLNYLKRIDEASTVNKKVTQLSLKSKDSILYERILLSSAITHYLKKEYQSSLDSIAKSKFINQKKTTRIGTEVTRNYYSGKNYFDLGEQELAIKYIKKVDSLAFAESYFPPGLRKNYELLIDYYKTKNNVKAQLFYINRLIKVDSIMDNDVKYLSREMNNQYTTPNLILEKERIINSLKNRKNITTVVIIVLIAIVASLIIWNRKRQKLYQDRFKELITKAAINEKNDRRSTPIKSRNDDISEKIVNDILTKLNDFENQRKYLKMNLTLAHVAKQLDTNSKYLSKVINSHKQKKFTDYINDLRINYTVEELKAVDSTLRKYSVKAIANEVGFNTTEAFSKSFYKTTGIYPSFFMKELEKGKINSPNHNVSQA